MGPGQWERPTSIAGLPIEIGNLGNMAFLCQGEKGVHNVFGRNIQNMVKTGQITSVSVPRWWLDVTEKPKGIDVTEKAKCKQRWLYVTENKHELEKLGLLKSARRLLHRNPLIDRFIRESL